MISVVIPALNAESHLPRSLAALIPAALDGLVREVIVVDGGSSDATRKIADAAGAEIIDAPPGRGGQLAVGARAARSPWLLFLHADTVLDEAWAVVARTFMSAVDHGERGPAAAAFAFRLDDQGLAPRLLERLVELRCAAFRLPYGDQALLLPRRLYEDVGGYRNLAIMEDVEFIRRLGRARVVMLKAWATTSAARYRRDGYIARSTRNLTCLALYGLGVPIEKIARIYGRENAAQTIDTSAPLKDMT